MKEQRARIVSTGTYLPKRILCNKYFESIVDTSDEWIVTRTGARERRIAEEGEFTSDMGYEAAKIVLDRFSLCTPDEIDMILVATISPDYIFPSTACLIQDRLGAHNSAAIDVQAACSGMMYALMMAKSFVESDIYKNVLVIASEKMSSMVDYTDRNTCVLFGDGAAACLVRKSSYGLRIGETSLGADGSHRDLLVMPAGGCRCPASESTVKEGKHYLKMDGKEVFKHAVRKMESSALKCLENAGLTKSDISFLIPHQANIRIIDALAKRFEVPEDRVIKTIRRYGNTSASSIGIGLDELMSSKKVANGDNLLLTTFGSGFTWGSMILTNEVEDRE